MVSVVANAIKENLYYKRNGGILMHRGNAKQNNKDACTTSWLLTVVFPFKKWGNILPIGVECHTAGADLK